MVMEFICDGLEFSLPHLIQLGTGKTHDKKFILFEE